MPHVLNWTYAHADTEQMFAERGGSGESKKYEQIVLVQCGGEVPLVDSCVVPNYALVHTNYLQTLTSVYRRNEKLPRDPFISFKFITALLLHLSATSSSGASKGMDSERLRDLSKVPRCG